MPAGLTLTPPTASLTVGESLQLTANPSPLKWFSSDESVATVGKSGRVNARGVGTAVITAKRGKLIAETTITVQAVAPPPEPEPIPEPVPEPIPEPVPVPEPVPEPQPEPIPEPEPDPVPPPIPDPLPTPTPPPATGKYPDFEKLAAHPKLLYVFPLRSQVEIDAIPTGAKEKPTPCVYDPAMDAMLQWIDPKVTGSNKPQQKHLPIALPYGTTFLHVWDHRVDGGWQWRDDGDNDTHTGYVQDQKTTRYDIARSTDWPYSWLNFRHRWQMGANNSAIAEHQLNGESGGRFILPGGTFGSEIPGPVTGRFWQQPDRWVRTWVYYDAAAKQVSAWQADVVQGIIQVRHKMPYDFPAVGIVAWRIYLDTSFDTFPALNPKAQMWHRNVIVLRDLTYDEVVPLLEAPTD